jgi:hypothetical protein
MRGGSMFFASFFSSCNHSREISICESFVKKSVKFYTFFTFLDIISHIVIIFITITKNYCISNFFMIKYSQQIGRDGDLKPVPIAEKTAKNLNGVASHPIIFRVLLWQIKLVLKHELKMKQYFTHSITIHITS